MRVLLTLTFSTLLWAPACQSTPPPTPTPQSVVPTRLSMPTLDWQSTSALVHEATSQASNTSSAQAMRPALALVQQVTQRATDAARKDYGAIVPRGLPAQPSVEDILERFANPQGALSLGSTSRGRLLNGQLVALDGAHHAVVPRARKRGTNFAAPMLKTMILDAAKDVAKAYPGSTLALGNLSKPRGGDIRWSVSHNSGRDADLAFYVKDARTGKRMRAPDLVAFDSQGRSRTKAHPHVVFDVERNWVLAKSLLMHPKGHVQYLFISNALKAKLLAHAQANGEPERVMERARSVLKQPTDSLPHDDHFHLRITCSLQERLLGCIDRGTQWSWVSWHEDHLLARVLAVQDGLMSTKDPDKARTMLSYLDALATRRGADVALTAALHHTDTGVRTRALKVALNNYAWSGAALALVMRVIDAPDSTFGHKRLGYKLLRRSVDPRVVEHMLARAQDPNTQVAERALAFNALTHHLDPSFIPVLMTTLASPHPVERDEAARLLRRLTNRDDKTEWSTASASERAGALRGWTTWLANNASKTREEWVTQGFEDVGVNPDVAGTIRSAPALIALLPKAPEHMVYNINKTLRVMTGRWSSLEQTNGARLAKTWGKWWRRNKTRLLASS